MKYNILHNGVPIGDVDLDLADDPAVGIVHPLPAYDSLRQRVRAATEAFRATALGLSAPGATSSGALSAGASLGRELELQDEQRQLIKVDFIELADWAGKPLDVTVWVRARGAFSGIPAKLPVPGQANSGSLRSDADAH